MLLLWWPHKNAPCLVANKTCNFCHKPGHFHKVCLSAKKANATHVKQLCTTTTPSSAQTTDTNSWSSSDDEYTYVINKSQTKSPKVNLKLNEKHYAITLRSLINVQARLLILDFLPQVHYYCAHSQLFIFHKFPLNILISNRFSSTWCHFKA